MGEDSQCWSWRHCEPCSNIRAFSLGCWKILSFRSFHKDRNWEVALTSGGLHLKQLNMHALTSGKRMDEGKAVDQRTSRKPLGILAQGCVCGLCLLTSATQPLPLCTSFWVPCPSKSGCRSSERNSQSPASWWQNLLDPACPRFQPSSWTLRDLSEENPSPTSSALVPL